MLQSNKLLPVLVSMALAIPANTFAENEPYAADSAKILNPDFETRTLKGWKNWRTKRAEISNNAHAGKFAVALGPESANCSQEVRIRNNSRYRLSAWVKTDAGSEQVELSARDFGGAPVSVASALPVYSRIAVEFTSAHACDTVTITLKHPSGPGKGYADLLELEYLGEAPPPTIQEFIKPTVTEPKTEGGVTTPPPRRHEMVSRREIRNVHPLGCLFLIRQGRGVDHAQQCHFP
jgi:hypothetical protein